MRILKTIILTVLLLALLSACQVEPTLVGEPETTQTEMATLTETPTAAPTEIALNPDPEEVQSDPTPEVVDECLNCHIDKQRLIDTAKPEEEVVSENEGEG